jgi:hypothetical protein
MIVLFRTTHFYTYAMGGRGGGGVQWGDYRKARIPKSPHTQKPLYRKAHVPKSLYTQKPSINQVSGWTTQFWPRFGPNNPNLDPVLGSYNPIMTTANTQFWWICQLLPDYGPDPESFCRAIIFRTNDHMIRPVVAWSEHQVCAIT